MKRPWVQLVVVGLIGIGVGRMLPVGREDGNDPAGAGSATAVRRSTKVTQRVENERTSSLDRWRREASAAKPEQIAALVSRVMEIADPLQRRIALMEILKYADASNGIDIIKGFVKITRESGRTNPEEWRDAIIEVGRRGGAELLDQWTEKGLGGGSQEVYSGLFGMALDDPKGAMSWLQSSKNQNIEGRNSLISAVVAGATLSNPDEGIRMMTELPLAERKDCIGSFTQSLIQSGGLDRAVDWMLNVQKSSADTEQDYANAVEAEVFDKISGAARWTEGSAEMAAFLARINATAPISPARLLNTIDSLHGTDALDVIDHLVQTPAMANNEAVDEALQVTASQAFQKSPEAVRQWLEKHPSSPIAGQLQKLLDGTGGG